MQEKDCSDVCGSIQLVNKPWASSFTLKPVVNGVIVELGYGGLDGTYVFTSVLGATDFITSRISGAQNVSK